MLHERGAMCIPQTLKLSYHYPYILHCSNRLHITFWSFWKPVSNETGLLHWTTSDHFFVISNIFRNTAILLVLTHFPSSLSLTEEIRVTSTTFNFSQWFTPWICIIKLNIRNLHHVVNSILQGRLKRFKQPLSMKSHLPVTTILSPRDVSAFVLELPNSPSCSIPGIQPNKPEGTWRLADWGPWKPGSLSADPFQTEPLNWALAPEGWGNGGGG